MPIYTLYCLNDECAYEEEWFGKIDEETPNCRLCDSNTSRKCECKSFQLKFNPRIDRCGWAADGYAQSQYWSEYNKQKAEGKKVEEPA